MVRLPLSTCFEDSKNEKDNKKQYEIQISKHKLTHLELSKNNLIANALFTKTLTSYERAIKIDIA